MYLADYMYGMWLAFDDPTILAPQNKCMFNLRAPVPIINP